MNRGFTVVEVLVTLVVMAILLGLGTVGLRSTLANGRDAERQADIDTIARSFEQRYKQGNQTYKAAVGMYETVTKNTLASFTYPGVMEVKYGLGYPKGEYDPATNTLGRELMYKVWGIPKSAAVSPSGNEIELVCMNACQPAENDAQIASAFSNNRTDRYVYEPIDDADNICNQDFNYDRCVRFNLYWISEVDTVVYKNIQGLKVLKSKRQ